MLTQHSAVIILLVLLLYPIATADDGSIKNIVPLVIWHGMGDNCCNDFGAGGFKLFIEQLLPGIYVKSLQIGSTPQEDSFNGFFLSVNTQVEMACQQLLADPKLAQGFNAIGFSQGSQFLRALVQRCGSIKMYNLISIGGQHQGVFGLPQCLGEHSIICHFIRRLLTIGVYMSLIQDYLVQAQYYHDPYDEDEYRLMCTFLPDINQELSFNPVYKERLSSLSNFVLIKFSNDRMVQPISTQWFGFYKPGQATETYSLFESRIYTEDLLGLKYLNDTGRLHFLASEGQHLQFSRDWFVNNILLFIDRTVGAEAFEPVGILSP